MLILVSLMIKFRFGGGGEESKLLYTNPTTLINIHNDNCIFLNITYKSSTVWSLVPEKSCVLSVTIKKKEQLTWTGFICVFQVLLAPPVARVQEWIPCGGHWHAGLRRVWLASRHWELPFRVPCDWRQGYCGVSRWGEGLCVSVVRQTTQMTTLAWLFLVSEINLFIILKLWLAFGPVPCCDKTVVTQSD